MPKGLILNVDTTKSEFQNPMVELRQGDGNYQSLYVTVTDNGDPFDLTGWTVSFMGTTAGSHKIIDANVVLDSTLVGAFTYTPTKAWGQDEGEFKNAYFKFVKSDETASGASFRVNVLNAVDLTDEEAKDYISVVDALIDQVKTDMDSKLADTQTTLSNTQSQADTVKTNVDDLNNNVNELKEQNNNLLTSDNTWSGNNTFSNTINGNISGNAATADKATTADKADSATSAETANDPNAVKLTGDQTIEGNKTFSNIISGSISGNAATADKANDPNAVHKTDISNVKVWQPNTVYNVNDVVYLTHINSNDMTLGQIDGGLMRCLVKHTSDSILFPSSDSGYWELINSEAYKISGSLAFGYGRVLTVQRIGNTLKMGYYATAGTIDKWGAGTTNLSEKLPSWANPDINGTDMVLYINSTDWPGSRYDWVLSIHNNANTSSFSSFGDIPSTVVLRGNGTTFTNTSPYWKSAAPTS